MEEFGTAESRRKDTVEGEKEEGEGDRRKEKENVSG